MYRVRLTALLLLQPLETLARSAGGQVTDSCQSTALLSGNHGSLRHSADPRVGRAATFPVGRARFRNLRRSRDIPPRAAEFPCGPWEKRSAALSAPTGADLDGAFYTGVSHST